MVGRLTREIQFQHRPDVELEATTVMAVFDKSQWACGDAGVHADTKRRQVVFVGPARRDGDDLKSPLHVWVVSLAGSLRPQAEPIPFDPLILRGLGAADGH